MSNTSRLSHIISATEQRFSQRTQQRRQAATTLNPKRVLADNDLLSVRFLKQALRAAKAVVRIHILSAEGIPQGFGSGFLISPHLLLTNNHVLGDADTAAYSQAEFNYELGENGQAEPSVQVALDPARLFLTDEALDYTLVALREDAALAAYGWLVLDGSADHIKVGEWVNIIQHPNAEPKQLALRDNQVIDLLEQFLHYRTDTAPGSSGSPVFNDQWQVVALHHSGVPQRDDQGRILATDGSVWEPDMGEHRIDWKANEGVRISQIVAHLQQQPLTPEQQALLAEAITPAATTGEPPTPELDAALAAVADNSGRDYYNAAADKLAAEAYYADIQTDAQPAGLFSQLSELVRTTHGQTYNYQPSTHVYPWVDLHPDRNIHSIYSGRSFEAEALIREDFRIEQQRAARLHEFLLAESTHVGRERLEMELDALEADLPYNCEHVVPQSWFQKKEPMRGDLHHLFACESGCNSFRGNTPYFDFADYEEVVRSDCGKREDSKFEPGNGKGAVARATLYFLLRYPGKVGDEARELQQERLPALLAWHAAFPPDEYEFHRNAAIFELQGNRNPLIDHPEWAENIDFGLGMGDT